MRKLYLLAAVLFFTGYLLQANAQEKIDMNALTQETQKVSQETSQMTMVWWIPEDFWRGSFAQNPNMSAAQVEEFLVILRPYIVVVAVDGTVGSFGNINYKPEADIRTAIEVRDSRGQVHVPLADESVDANAKSILMTMKPVFANMLGPMGQNMHFFLFPAKDANGNSIAEAAGEGSFTVKLGEKEFKWKLPLSSLLAPKICPACGEKLSGAYKFCPWDGTELQLKKEE